MARKYLGIIDCGVGNHQSVVNALDQLGIRSVISNKTSKLEGAAGLILPGVGAFGEMAAGLKVHELDAFILQQVKKNKVPLLGVCLGMQILADSSDEDSQVKGLGLIPGHFEKLKSDALSQRRVPHVGWNDFSTYRNSSPLFKKYDKGQTFYFDHSYHFAGNDQFASSKTSYFGDIVASIELNHVFGVQFHPEKSQLTGLRLLRGYSDFCGVK